MAFFYAVHLFTNGMMIFFTSAVRHPATAGSAVHGSSMRVKLQMPPSDGMTSRMGQ